MQNTHIQINNLSKVFTQHILRGKQINAFKGVSFGVERGLFVGIAGLSGSGKSSILKCIFGTYVASSGEIIYQLENNAVIDLAQSNARQITRLRGSEIGFVSQFLRAQPRTTALELVARPLLNAGVPRPEATERAQVMLERLGISSELWDGYPVFFSGGEQQRVNIAQALIRQPRLLLLDEPTSALDDRNQSVVISLLEEAKQSGVTIIGVFHDRALLNRLSDKVITMEYGRLLV
jgi:alpha-D-ribose 1-methylphosphonate 5-triphosphate synthase subunit PhnL